MIAELIGSAQGSIGAMSDADDELDEVFAHAMDLHRQPTS
jgi:hypothetical protein